MRSTTHSPGGGVQSSVPSGRIFDGQIHDAGLCAAHHPRRSPASAGRRGRRAARTRPSPRTDCTRAPVCSTNSAISCSLGGGGRGMSISPSPDGPGGNVRNVTLKNRARTGGNATVFCLAWLLGMLTTLRKLRPSSLASRSGPRRWRPEGEDEPGQCQRDAANRPAAVRRRIWIHAFSPTGALGNGAGLDEVAVPQQRRVERCRRSR